MHIVHSVHVRKLKWVKVLGKKMYEDITWFTILTDIDKSCDRIYCHICPADHKGRRVKEAITAFSLKHCDENHQKKYIEWKSDHPFHSFQKKIAHSGCIFLI